MRHNHYARIVLAFSTLCVPATQAHGQSDTNSPNHFRFVSRAAFNITARFSQAGAIALSPSGRTTPNGNAYNYDDGYVLTDVSGSQGGQTWNWGYDNSSQISGNTIQLHHNTVSQNVSSAATSDLPTPGLGGEVIYDREFGSWHGVRYGAESALSYMNISLKASGYATGDITQTTDAYGFSGTPPQAPYQGTFNGPGFLLGSTPMNSASTVIAGGANITSQQQINADVWGVRLGPYLEFPVADRIDLLLSGGLSVALLDATMSWSETVNLSSGGSLSGSGGGNDMSLCWGGYLAANLSWQLTKRWDFEAGLQYQYLNNYQHSFGGSQVELDMRKSIFVTWGLSYSF